MEVGVRLAWACIESSNMSIASWWLPLMVSASMAAASVESVDSRQE
jgi:hypothetical protein